MTVIAPDRGVAYPEPVITIRQAKAMDSSRIAELRALSSAGVAPTRQFAELMRTWLEAEGEPRITLIASIHERPAGMISMLEYRGMPVPDGMQSRWGYLDHLFVREDVRCRGVGTELIRETMSIADRRSYARMLVSPTSSALSLFHRLGFSMLDELGPEGILLWRQKPQLQQ